MIAHYKNGREAKNGDRVLWSPPYRPERIAPLYDVEPDSSSGHAKFVTEDPLPLYVNLKECLHLDDALAALRANAVVDDATAGSHPIDLSKPLPGEIKTTPQSRASSGFITYDTSGGHCTFCGRLECKGTCVQGGS